MNDCWNRIGIQGDGSCAELPKVVHCRHCPVYSGAAAQLLNRSLPAEYRRQWTEHFARPRSTPPAARNSAVVFRVGPEWLALPTSVFQEVTQQGRVHSIPHQRRGIVAGLVNIGGELLICVMLERLLSLGQAAPAIPPRNVYPRLLVLNGDARRVVFAVDEVLGIHRFDAAQLGPLPATLSRSAKTLTDGVFFWRDVSVGLLNADQLFGVLNESLM